MQKLGTEGVPMELLQMAIPVIRGDFTILETYKLSGVNLEPPSLANGEEEKSNPTTNPTVQVRCPITAFGGGLDSLCAIDKLLNWKKFSRNSAIEDDRSIIFLPNTEPRQKMFNAYVDASGGHFTFLDKLNGGEAWFKSILIDICLRENDM
jgi:hypothetical protein